MRKPVVITNNDLAMIQDLQLRDTGYRMYRFLDGASSNRFKENGEHVVCMDCEEEVARKRNNPRYRNDVARHNADHRNRNEWSVLVDLTWHEKWETYQECIARAGRDVPAQAV